MLQSINSERKLGSRRGRKTLAPKILLWFLSRNAAQSLKKAFGAGKGGSVLISRQISDVASINHFSSTREPLFQGRLAGAKGQCQAVQTALKLWEGKNSSALTAVCENRSGCFTTEAPHSSTIHCRCSEEIRWNQLPQCFISHWSWHYSPSPRVFVPIHKPP